VKEEVKLVFWMGSSLKETKSFPEPVRREIERRKG
jgi:hypothetical protein